MSKSFREDLTGQQFGKFTVIEFVPNNEQAFFWKCMCNCCGSELVLSQTELRRQGTRKDRDRLRSIWYLIKRRCNDERDKRFNIYGGRGIKVCEEWEKSLDSFVNWALQNKYDEKLTIDRIDVNGNYEPDNCRWIDIKQQENNRRNNIWVEYQEKTISLKNAAELSGIGYMTLYQRYKRGDRGEKLFRNIK